VQDDCIAVALGLPRLKILWQKELEGHIEATVMYRREEATCPWCGRVTHKEHDRRPQSKQDRRLRDKVVFLVLIKRRLVESYRKGLYADFMMREDMELIQKEQGELEKRKVELERQLAQRFLTQNQEAHIKSLAEKISIGLDNLDFTGKQELLRLLVEKVFYNGQSIEILTIIPLSEQLHPIHRGG